MQPVENRGVGAPGQKRPIRMDAVAGQQGRPRRGHGPLDIGEQVGRRGRCGRARLEDGGGEARATVGVDTPRRHGPERGCGLVNHGLEPGLVEDLQLRVCDDAADLEDLVVRRIKAGHLY